MSDILSRYETSNKTRVVQARMIPGQEVNFTDTQNVFQKQFDNFPQLRKTTYTESAIDHYTDELEQIVVPESFTPTEPGINLNRWNSDTKYYIPGQHAG